MKFENNDKNRIYKSIKADSELKDKILKESIKTIKTVSLPGDDELSLRRNEKMKKKEYGDVLKKVVVASLSLVATGAIVVGGVMLKFGGNSNGGNVAKNTTEITTDNKTTEKTTEGKDEKKDEAISKEDALKLGIKDVKSWADEEFKKILKSSYDKNDKLKKGYEERVYTSENGEKIAVVGKDFVEIEAKDSKAYDCEEYEGKLVYFLCEDGLCRIKLDTILKEGQFIDTPDDFEFTSDDDITDYVYKVSDGEMYAWDKELGYSNQGIISLFDSDTDKMEYDEIRKRIVATHKKELKSIFGECWMGDGNVEYINKMGLYLNDERVDEINTYSWFWDSAKYGEETNMADLYYVSEDNKLYEIEGMKYSPEKDVNVVSAKYEKKLIAENVLKVNYSEDDLEVIPLEKGYKEVAKPSRGNIKLVSEEE